MSKNKTKPPSPNEKSKNNTSFIKRLKHHIFRLLRIKTSVTIEDELNDLFDECDPDGKEVSKEERVILKNVLCFGDLKVNDIMVPRTDIIAVEESIDIDNLKNIIITKEHTRIPVYKDSLDNVVGFIHSKDLIAFIGNNKQLDIKSILRSTIFVPPSMKIIDLLIKMKEERVHISIVLDEYGGTMGLITLEDLMEEIVGEIEDEHDDITKKFIKKLDDNNYEISARATISEVEEALELNLKTNSEVEDYDTIGGLVFFMLGRIPKINETITHKSGIEFKVLDADLRKIKKIKLTKNN